MGAIVYIKDRGKQGKRFFKSYPKTFGIIALFLIVLAVPLTVYIAQQQQETRQRAECPQVCDTQNVCETKNICDSREVCDYDENDAPYNCRAEEYNCRDEEVCEDKQVNCRRECATCEPGARWEGCTGSFGACSSGTAEYISKHCVEDGSTWQIDDNRCEANCFTTVGCPGYSPCDQDGQACTNANGQSCTKARTDTCDYSGTTFCKYECTGNCNTNPSPPPPANCPQPGLYDCSGAIGVPQGTCQKDGKECTAYSRWVCDANGGNYCDSGNCGEPCTGVGGSVCIPGDWKKVSCPGNCVCPAGEAETEIAYCKSDGSGWDEENTYGVCTSGEGCEPPPNCNDTEKQGNCPSGKIVGTGSHVNPDTNCENQGGIYCHDDTLAYCCYNHDGNLANGYEQCQEGQQGNCVDLGNGSIWVKNGWSGQVFKMISSSNVSCTNGFTGSNIVVLNNGTVSGTDKNNGIDGKIFSLGSGECGQVDGPCGSCKSSGCGTTPSVPPFSPPPTVPPPTLPPGCPGIPAVSNVRIECPYCK